MQTYSDVVRHELRRLDDSELLRRAKSSDLTDEARGIAVSILSERGVALQAESPEQSTLATTETVAPFNEEAAYAAALSELTAGKVRPGLWAKAFAECEGDNQKSQALYIRLRAQEERDQFRADARLGAVAKSIESDSLSAFQKVNW